MMETGSPRRSATLADMTPQAYFTRRGSLPIGSNGDRKRLGQITLVSRRRPLCISPGARPRAVTTREAGGADGAVHRAGLPDLDFFAGSDAPRDGAADR